MRELRKISPEDQEYLIEIAQRVRRIKGRGFSVLSFQMDLMYIHENLIELDFLKLHQFDLMNFLHDVNGILQHHNRSTKELTNCFTPRCSK